MSAKFDSMFTRIRWIFSLLAVMVATVSPPTALASQNNGDELLVRAREAGRLTCGAYFVGALNRPASSAASARFTCRTDLPK